MYSTGKITTTANNTKVIGTNTKWKDNNSLVSPEQVILIQNGATIYINSIASIQSNTEMTLSFPVPAAIKDATYNILTTMVHSVSDAANKIVAMNNANVQFSDILHRWATETGTITVTLPDGTTQQLRTAKEMDKQLDGKENGNRFKTIATNVSISPPEGNISLVLQNDGTLFMWDGAKSIFRISSSGEITTGSMSYSRLINVPIVQVIGTSITSFMSQKAVTDALSGLADGKRFKVSATNSSILPPSGNISLVLQDDGTLFTWNGTTSMFSIAPDGRLLKGAIPFERLTGVTVDSNGNVKKASPIVKLFADHVELNEESEGIELKKLHTGIYQLKNVLGMHSDASWGGINGGITIPSGINQLPLVYVDYDVLVAGEQHPFNGELITADEHGDIVIYTSYRKHFNLPQNVQYAHLKTYPEFTKVVNDEQVELENGEPVDIPNGHWIDVRVNMPSNSIYNQKQAEAERLAKEVAEKQEREEAEAEENIEKQDK
ncbi:WD40 repeat protein [Providencia alcalifaciens]|nr:WD40 repeat protein [Providencia alcalifaciens]MCW2254994.1 WD40 repeat protein [Providencia alcalifaciens]